MIVRRACRSIIASLSSSSSLPSSHRLSSSPSIVRCFHTSPRALLVVGSGGGPRTRARSSPSPNPSPIVAAAAPPSPPLSRRAQAALDEETARADRFAEAEAIVQAESGAGAYRKPKHKSKGKAYMDAQRAMGEEYATKQRQKEDTEARKDAQERQVADENQAEVPTPIIPSSLNPSLTSTLRQLDLHASTPPSQLRGRGGAVGIGFDSIDLVSPGTISLDEVFQRKQYTRGMRRLLDDPDRRGLAQRVERVTERTKELVAMVLMEQSVKVEHAMKVKQQRGAKAIPPLPTKQPSSSSSPASPRSPSPSAPRSSSSSSPKPSSSSASAADRKVDLTSLADLRMHPSFRVQAIKFSTDLAWGSVMWTLGKSGYDVTIDAEEGADEEQMRAIESTNNRLLQQRYQRPAPPPSSSSASGAAAVLPNWFATRRQIALTLAQTIVPLRSRICTDIDLRYAPNIRFTYDHLQEALESKAARERARAEEDEQQRRASSPTPADAYDGSEPHRLNLAQQQKANARYDDEYDANRTYFLSKKKIKALVKNQADYVKKKEKIEKDKKFFAIAHAASRGVSTRSPDGGESGADEYDRPRSTDPIELRADLRRTLARLVQQRNPESPAVMKNIRATSVELQQLNQVRALEKSRVRNPVLELKVKREKDMMPHYPKGWRDMKNQYFRH